MMEELRKDAERYRWLRNNTSIMIFELQVWKTSHKLDWAVDELMEKDKMEKDNERLQGIQILPSN
jgi:hypothetical protein